VICVNRRPAFDGVNVYRRDGNSSVNLPGRMRPDTFARLGRAAGR
jgi:hypothetical protein